MDHKKTVYRIEYTSKASTISELEFVPEESNSYGWFIVPAASLSQGVGLGIITSWGNLQAQCFRYNAED
ncbi:hypothetical protein PS15m_008883 [Mucor circinelloides]